MPSSFKTLILVLLSTFSFLAVGKVVVAGSADGKAVFCECEEGKACGNLSHSSTVFAVFFESGLVNMRYPELGGVCGRRICLGDLNKFRGDDGPRYEDGYEEIRWGVKSYFGMNYSLNRETLLLSESDYFGRSNYTYYKRCEVLKPSLALERIKSYISARNDEIDAERKEKTKKNKI